MMLTDTERKRFVSEKIQ